MTDAEAGTPIFSSSDANSQLIGKVPDAGKDWRQKEKRVSEDEMTGWHHQLSRHEFEQALGVGDRKGSLVCCSPWDRKESDITEWLNWLIGRTDAEAKAPVFWSPDSLEGLMAEWHHQCNGHELGQTPGDGEGQRGLECSSPRGREELDMTGWLHDNKMQL